MTDRRAHVALLALLATGPALSGQAPPAAPPRLLVLCAVDQLATWVLQAALPHLGEGGVRRVLREGVEFTQCAYQHACTETGPGHATLGTGAPARIHGIVKNQWHAPDDGAPVYCADEPGVAALPGLPEGANRGPGRLLVPTFADGLRAHFGSATRIVSLAWKDRSAILMAGASADAVAWFDSTTGRLVTNTRWGKTAPAWLTAFNGAHRLDAFFGWKWERFGPEAAYADLTDDRPFEQPQPNAIRSHTLPVVVDGGVRTPQRQFWVHAFYSPVCNEVTEFAAEAAWDAENLGEDDVPDLLCISFSGNDTIGHAFGADSVEARDALLRTDALLARLFVRLDERVGAGRWMLVLSADHGVSQTPEVLRAKGVPARRGLFQVRARSAAETALVTRYGAPATKGTYVRMVAEMGIFLDHARLAACAGERPEPEVIAEAADVVVRAVQRVPGIHCAVAVHELLRAGPGDDPLRRALFDSLYPDRAGDVLLVLQPHFAEGNVPGMHGTPWPYDREVPLLAMGGGLRAGYRCPQPVSPGLGVVLMAHALGLPRPPGAVEDPPAGVFEQ